MSEKEDMMEKFPKLKLKITPKMPTGPELEELRQRNEARVAAAREKLGHRHILHPDNQGVNWGWRTNSDT